MYDRKVFIDIYRYVILGGKMPKTMREIELTQKRIILKDEVESIYEKTVTPFGTSAKADVPRKYIGKRVYVVVLKK